MGLVAYYGLSWALFAAMVKYGNDDEISVCDTVLLISVLPLVSALVVLMILPLMAVFMAFDWCIKRMCKRIGFRAPSMPRCPIIRIRK